MKNLAGPLGYILAAIAGACFAGALVAIIWMEHRDAGPKPPSPPVIQVPTKATADPGIAVPLDIETKLGTIKWCNLSGAGKCSLIVQGNGHQAIFSAPTPGDYCLAVWGAKGGEPTDLFRFTVKVGSAPPGPGPGPTPPEPTDPLTQALQSAYNAESDSDKAMTLKKLADLYALSASSLATDVNAHTWGDLFQAILQAGVAAGMQGKIPGVQAVIQKELTANLPTDPKVSLDDPGREKAAAEFNKVSKALQGVKP